MSLKRDQISHRIRNDRKRSFKTWIKKMTWHNFEIPFRPIHKRLIIGLDQQNIFPQKKKIPKFTQFRFCQRYMLQKRLTYHWSRGSSLGMSCARVSKRWRLTCGRINLRTSTVTIMRITRGLNDQIIWCR